MKIRENVYARYVGPPMRFVGFSPSDALEDQQDFERFAAIPGSIFSLVVDYEKEFPPMDGKEP